MENKLRFGGIVVKITPDFCENGAEKRMLHIEGFSLREVMLSRTKGCSKIMFGNIYKNQAQDKWITYVMMT